MGMAAAGEFMVALPQDAVPGAYMMVTAPSGQTSLLTVPPDGAPGQEIKCVQCKNAGLPAGSFTGGGGEGVFKAAAVINNTLSGNVAKKPGQGVFIPCGKCHVNNETKMTMSNMAQFDCGSCGCLVRWSPRQVWLRDQGAR